MKPTVTRAQIEAMRAESVEAGDMRMVDDCDLALLAFSKPPMFARSAIRRVEEAIAFCPPEPLP